MRALEVPQTRELAPPLLGRQRARRALVLCLAVVCVLLVEEPAIGALTNVYWEVTSGVCLAAVLLGLNLTLRQATRRTAVTPIEALDERQEAIRNRAYRLSHRVLVVCFGLPLWGLFLHVGFTFGKPAWLVGAVDNAGIVIVYLELLYFLPTAIIAWIEPDALEDEEVRRGRLSWPKRALLVAGIMGILLPFELSATVPFVTQTSKSFQNPLPLPAAATRNCRYVNEAKTAGFGAQARIHLFGMLCWNGRRIWPSWGLSGQDGCPLLETFLTVVNMRCSMTYDSDRSIHIRDTATVRLALIPVVARHLNIDLVVRPDGHIERFT